MANYDFEKVFSLFRRKYKLVPLEFFKKDPYKTLVSTILSSRTKDEVTLLASERLFKKATNIKKLEQLEQLEIRKAIFPVGFYKTKAAHLKKLAKMINNKYKSEIPDSLEELIKLPGVGRKTAIAVDTHVHKISNLLGWVKTKMPEQTERELVKILPKKYWPEINRLFVSVGRRFTSRKKLIEFLKENNLLK